MVSFPSFSQKPWRTLTFNNINGISNDGKQFNTVSSNLYYGLKNNYSIQSWSGYQIHRNPNFQWFSTQTSFVKNINQLGLGLGVQYGTNGTNANSTYLISTISYQFKL